MAITENLINGSGSNTYNFTFPILEAQDLRVQLREFDPTQTTDSQIISEIDTTLFNVLNTPDRVVFQPISSETAYQDTNGNVKTTSTNGYQVVIRIYRKTDIDATAVTLYSGSALRADDLNNNFTQLLFSAQESDAELNNIFAGELPDNSIPGTALESNAITTVKILDGNVTAAKLNSNAVITSKIQDNAVTTSKINNNAVTTIKIIDDGVTTPKIVNDAVTTAKILNANVTTAKIADANVTTVKIADDAVTTAKIADANVTTAKIADANVTTAKIADANVTTAKIADDAVTSAKLDPGIIFVPTGAITAFGGSTAPTGYLECNGQSTSGYAALAAVVGANVPDLRGEFIRGWDHGRGVDAGRNLLTTQADEFKAHTHTGSSVAKVGGGISVAPGSSNSYGSTTIASDGGVETRPRNVSLMYIIKT